MTLLEKFLDVSFEEVIGDRFGRYSKYIIQDRALPDARDGLKPVQRRILYAMHTEGNTADKSFRKAAKTVGTVIGNFHPHGDSSVYDAMVRMSQEWKMRHPLVQMHGNNGSIDGDPQAAMRYTEARLSTIASELLRDIERETVSFAPNFDDSDQEPTVLPARFPQLLVNGSTGISSGYATDIPPHPLGEVIDACLMQIDNPHVSVEELMTVLKGPDFPTGGIIQGVEGIKQAYQTGKGKIVLRGKTAIERIKGGREQIVITEIPYDVVKANMVRRMDELRIDRKVDGIQEVRDETDRNGLRIVIELKRDADADGILHYLYKHTDLQILYHFNMVAISNQSPKLMNLQEILSSYIAHQKEVIRHRCQYDLAKAKDRYHIVEGLMRALSVLDEVIATIRASRDRKNATDNLIHQFQFSKRQAEAIVNLQLYRLTNTDITQLRDESEQLEQSIQDLESILANETKLIAVIKKELKQIQKKFSDERLSVIEKDIEPLKIDMEVVVPAVDVMVTVTQDGYVKRTSLRSYNASKPEELGKKDDDSLLHQFEANTTDILLMFTSQGNYLYVPVHELPDIRWKEMGQHIGNLIPLDKGEQIIKAVVVKDFGQDGQWLIFFTKQGMVKRSALSEYKAKRYSKPLMATRLKPGDELVEVYITDGTDDIIISTHQGYFLWFEQEEVSVTGQKTRGVKGIDVRDQDYVISALLVDAEEAKHRLQAVTNRGSVKNVTIVDTQKKNRARKGELLLKNTKRTRLSRVQY